MKNRLFLISWLLGTALGSCALAQSAAPVAESEPRSVRIPATATTLTISSGTLSEPITFDVSVRALVAAGSPEGSVALLDQEGVIETLTLSPMTNSPNPKFAYSAASFTLTTEPGAAARYFFGRETIKAQFAPSTNSPGTNYLKSSSSRTFTVKQPKYLTLIRGVKVATIVQGSGPAIQYGQTASVFYAGYLKNGQIFDNSLKDGGTAFSFTLAGGQVVPGFDIGVAGMQAGETRIVEIPPAQGYGAAGSPPKVPPNATLIFVITLESIS